MKKIFYNVSIVILVLACLLGTLVGCEKTSIDPQKYTSYCCYDYHLKCLKVEGKKAKIEISYSDDLTGVDYTQYAWLQKIVGESDDMFIYAQVLPPLSLGQSDKVIFQNPDNYVDIWNDWTIQKIELYYLDGKDPIKQDETANIPNGVVASTIASECLTEFTTFVNTDHATEKWAVPNGYVREDIDNNGTGYRYYARVYFNESENIVWDTEILSYFSSEQQDRIIFIDDGKQPEGIASINSNDVSISNYPELFEWLSNSINDFDPQQ